MDFRLTEEQRMWRDSVQKLTERIATPEYLRRLDRERSYPEELYAAWVEAGLLRLPFPEDYGGLGQSIVDLAIVAEEMSRPSADVVMAFGGSMFCGLNVLRKGSQEQKRYWLPRLLSGEVKMSISISEPDAGSDVGAIRTNARKDGDYYVINGQKVWATGAAAKNDVINVYVRTAPQAHYRAGLSLFLVDNDMPGLQVRRIEMLGRRSVGTYELTFNDVRVPAGRLVGGENKGWDCILSGLQVERVVAAACDCGSARGVFELALQYAKDRKQFGRPIGTFQAIAHMLADMQTEIEAAWSLTLRAASLASDGQDALREITMAKLAAAEAYVRAAGNGMQIAGGLGYSMEFDMQRHFRDARAATVAAGSSQIQRNLLAGLMGLKVQ
jgi:alkylation response protein AidB-like acyl-CoA dehydrogenase